MRLPLRSELQVYMREHGVSEDQAKIALWPDDLELEKLAHFYWHDQNVPYEEARRILRRSQGVVVKLLAKREWLKGEVDVFENEVEMALDAVDSAQDSEDEDEIHWAKQDLSRAQQDYQISKHELNEVLRRLELEEWTY